MWASLLLNGTLALNPMAATNGSDMEAVDNGTVTSGQDRTVLPNVTDGSGSSNFTGETRLTQWTEGARVEDRPWTTDTSGSGNTSSPAVTITTATLPPSSAGPQAEESFTNSSWLDHLTSSLTSSSSAADNSAPSTFASHQGGTTTSSWSTTLSGGSGGDGGAIQGHGNVTESWPLTVEEAEEQAPKGSDIKELVYVIIVIAFYSAALLALVILQIRRYYTRHSSYTSFSSGDPAEDCGGGGYDLYEEYSEQRQLIFQESRRADNERKVRRIQGVANGYNIDAIPEHVV